MDSIACVTTDVREALDQDRTIGNVGQIDIQTSGTVIVRSAGSLAIQREDNHSGVAEVGRQTGSRLVVKVEDTRQIGKRLIHACVIEIDRTIQDRWQDGINQQERGVGTLDIEVQSEARIAGRRETVGQAECDV